MTGCWEWKGKKRYPRIVVYKRRLSAHRLMYQLRWGQIPNGQIVMHKCDNPSCMNPEHLTVGTRSENTADRHQKGRDAKAEGHGMAKLNWAKVEEIRKNPHGLTARAFSQLFGISRTHVYNILRGNSWRKDA